MANVVFLMKIVSFLFIFVKEFFLSELFNVHSSYPSRAAESNEMLFRLKDCIYSLTAVQSDHFHKFHKFLTFFFVKM